MHVSRNLAICWMSLGQYFFAENNFGTKSKISPRKKRWNSDEILSYLHNIKNSLYLKHPISIRFRWNKCSRADFFGNFFHWIRNHFQYFLSTCLCQISLWKFFFWDFHEINTVINKRQRGMKTWWADYRRTDI